MDGWIVFLAITGFLALTLLGLWLYTSAIARASEQRYPPQGKHIQVDGIRLHYVDKGEGPAVILLHGDAGSLYDYILSPLVDLLSRHYRVLVFDRPGLGYSERPKNGGSPLVQAQLVHGAARKLGIEKAVVVGHSRGGPVALAYGAQFPEETAAVVPLAGAHYWDGSGTPSFNRLLLIPGLGPLLAHTLYVPFGRGITELLLNVAFSPERIPPPEYVAAYTAMNLRPKQLLSAASDQGESAPDMRKLIAHYKNFPVPVVIVHGTADRNVPFAGSQHLHGEIPGSELVPLQNGSHEIMITRAEQIAASIQRAWELGGKQPQNTPSLYLLR